MAGFDLLPQRTNIQLNEKKQNHINDSINNDTSNNNHNVLHHYSIHLPIPRPVEFPISQQTYTTTLRILQCNDSRFLFIFPPTPWSRLWPCDYRDNIEATCLEFHRLHRSVCVIGNLWGTYLTVHSFAHVTIAARMATSTHFIIPLLPLRISGR